LKGWNEFTKSEWINFAKKGYDSLPKNLKEYMTYIEKESRIPIKVLSFGPERRCTMKKEEANN
jgi:adenylosuccinate synthase